MAGHRLRHYRDPQWASKPIPTRRLPYGHRADSHDLIGDPHIVALNADWFPGARGIGMPRNRGRRWLVRCPKCGREVKTLYRPQGCAPVDLPMGERQCHPFPALTDFWWCRHCWGLRYRSQYQGRRPEAGGLWDASRLEQLSGWLSR
jgi:hypothetical protein